MKKPLKTMPAIDLPEPPSVAEILGDLRQLPLMPSTAQQAMSLASRDDCNIAQFTALMEKDVTLASSVLKLANSPLFNWGRSIDCVDQAVIRLGMQEVRNLITAVSMQQLYAKSDPTTRGYCCVLWNHCFLTACFARRLNREVKFNYRGEEFAAGLLHDLGRILLAVALPAQFARADPMNFDEGPDLLDAERTIVGTDHCELGALYAQENQLPLAVIASIRDHHRFADVKEHRGILGLVVAADHMANHIQRGDPLAVYDLNANPGFAFLSRTWSKETTANFAQLVPKMMRETVKQAEAQSRPEPTTTPKTTKKSESMWDMVCSWF